MILQSRSASDLMDVSVNVDLWWILVNNDFFSPLLSDHLPLLKVSTLYTLFIYYLSFSKFLIREPQCGSKVPHVSDWRESRDSRQREELGGGGGGVEEAAGCNHWLPVTVQVPNKCSVTRARPRVGPEPPPRPRTGGAADPGSDVLIPERRSGLLPN